MKKYKPIKGVTSKKMAEKFLKSNLKRLNEHPKLCPLLDKSCVDLYCAAWKPAEVYLSNPGRMIEEQSVYDIRLGRCISPLITGKMEYSK